MILDMRKQRIYAVLSGKTSVTLGHLSDRADVSKQFAAKQLKLLGWKKRHPNGEYVLSSLPQSNTLRDANA
jgi:hypothetical protein